MSEPADIVIIGAGVIGLAVARACARAGLAPLVLEEGPLFGSGISSRNSEVIHAGLYYAPESDKARLCVAGRDQLYRYCRDMDVPHRRLGKLIIAANGDEVAALDQIEANASAAGVNDLIRLGGGEAAALEPAITCHAALLSLSTGIIDSHSLMSRLLAEMENGGGQFVPHCRVTGLSRMTGGWGIHVAGESEPAAVAARVVNAAGLAAHHLATRTEGLAAAHVPQVRFARGNYFAYRGKAPFTRLIYPVPVPGGLGTHLTLDMQGDARFGPDVEWVNTPDFTVDPARKERFVEAARRFWPTIDPERLDPAYAGIRPKLTTAGEAPADFRIDGPERHGLPGLVNLFGIESPGLTACLAIADEVTGRLDIPRRGFR